MEAFSLLKYWRGAGAGGGGDATAPAATLATTDTTSNAAATAILTAVAENDVEETDDDDDSDNENEDDDGPFFDLEFTLPDDSEDSPQNLNEEDHTASDSDNHSDEQENINNNNKNDDNSSEDSEGDEEGESGREIKFTLSPSTSSNDRSDPNLSDDVVFKGELVQLEPSSFVLNSSSSEPNSKPQFTARASLLKSATKFRVFMMGLKKPNKPNNVSAASEKDPNRPVDPGAPNSKQQRKLFTVKFKVEEVPIMSLLFTRSDNSSKGGKAASSAAGASANSKEDSQAQSQPSHSSSASEEKRLMRKYLRMVKPLYVKVSRRYAEKLRFSGQLNMTASASSPTAEKKEKEKEGDNIAAAAAASSEAAGTNGKGQKQGNLPLPAGLRVVCKHLGKSRSASSVAAPAPAPVSAADPAGLVSSKRRDDSLLQQQDGIQGAILHCKRSFNASRDQCESSQLPRSVSDPLHEVSPELSRKSANEGNDKRP